MLFESKKFGSWIFMIVCGLAAVMTIYNIAIDIYLENIFNLAINIIGLAFYFTAIVITAKYQLHRKLTYPTFVVTLILILVLWVTRGGAMAMAPFYLTFLILTLVLIDKVRRSRVLVFLLSTLLVLVYLEYILKMDFGQSSNKTFPVDFVILSFISVAVLLAFKKNFEAERNQSIKYAKSLKQLHRLNLSKGDFKNLIKDYLASGCELFNIDNGFVAQMDGRYATLICTFGDMADKSLPLKLSSSEIFHLEDLRSGKTVQFALAKDDDTIPLLNLEVRSFLAAPIFIGERMTGLLVYFSSTPRSKDFEPLDLELIELMSQNISHLMKIQNDEMQNKRINEALLQSELRFRSIFEKSPVGIALTALDGDFLLVNPAMQMMLGYDEYDFLQMNVRDILTDSSGARSRWEQLKQGLLDTYIIEHDALHKSGSIVKISVATSLVKRHGMDRPLVLGIVEDITHLKAKEKQIEELNAKLEQQVNKLQAAYKELESFSYSISHDLRAPLRAINSFANIMHEEYGHKLDQEGNRLLRIISRNGERMGNLIDDLLEFSRLSRLDKVFSKFSLQSLVHETINELRDSYPNKKFQFVVGELPVINGDRAMIRQLLQNLISNAMKFSSKSDNPQVEIFSADAEEGYYQIGIRDNGVGFDMRYYDKLFGVFQRLHSEQEFDGTGVGLAIVQRIVSRHEGKIWAESKLGEGAVFYFTLHV